jgi:hypothetical protein
MYRLVGKLEVVPLSRRSRSSAFCLLNLGTRLMPTFVKAHRRKGRAVKSYLRNSRHLPHQNQTWEQMSRARKNRVNSREFNTNMKLWERGRSHPTNATYDPKRGGHGYVDHRARGGKRAKGLSLGIITSLEMHRHGSVAKNIAWLHKDPASLKAAVAEHRAELKQRASMLRTKIYRGVKSRTRREFLFKRYGI